MRPTLIAAVALTIFGIAACSDTDSQGSTSPSVESKLEVVLSVDADTILESTTSRLSARVTDQTGALKLAAVTWTSTNPAVASVSTGVVTGIRPGTAMIIASAGTGADSALILVTPNEAVLDVHPSAAIVALGDTIRFVATTRDDNGNSVSVNQLQWSSSDTVAARFIGGGMLVARAEGELSVSAASADRRGTGSVKVFRAPVASVTIAPSTANVYQGEKLALEVTLRDQPGRLVEGDVNFGSSDYSKATVNQDGIVTGISPGSVIITATSGTKTGSATITVLGAPAASVALSVPDTVPVGVEVELSATPLDASGSPLSGRTITYQSANPAVAAVNNQNQTVKGITAGATTISAIVDGIVASERLTVGGRYATSISITPGSPSISVGQQSQLTAKVLDQAGTEIAGQPVSWSSTNQAVATVSSTGLVSATSAGSTTISAGSGGLSASVEVSVVNVPVAYVRISPSTASLVVGGSPVTLTATAFDANERQLAGRVASWSSQNPIVATVNSSGVVSAIAAGSTTITGSIEGKTASVTVTVGSAPAAAVASVTVSLASAALNVGQQTQASALIKDAQGNTLSRAVSWSSLDTGVAKVSASGVVTAYAGGTVAIMARSEDVSGYASLTVTTPSPTAVASVTLDAPTWSLNVGQQVPTSVTLKDAAGNLLTGRTITYSTGNSSVLTVSSSGVLTGVGSGMTEVRATSGGVTDDAVFTVAGTTGAIASITVTPASATLSVGQTSQETAVAKDAQGSVIDGTSFTWTTSNPAAAIVSSAGTVSAVGAGTATIRAAAGGVTGSMSVSVTSTVATVASVAVTLSNTNIQVGGTAQASAVAKDASGNVLPGTVFTWKSSSTSVAAVSTSGLVNGVSTGTAQITASVAGVAGSANVSVSGTSTPPPSGTIPTIVSLIGQTKTVTETAVMGYAFVEYDRLFDKYFPIINDPSNPNRLSNYYDRSKAYYARYVRTGDAKFLRLGDELALAYRQSYLEPNNYGVQPHWSQVLGLEIHYRLTGDTLSRRAVAGLYAYSLNSFAVPRSGSPLAAIENTQVPYMENRIQARVLQGALSAYRMGASFRRHDGPAFLASEWPTRLRDMLNKILSTQNANGSFSWIQICGGQLNYMVGMLNDVLIEYYRDFEPDPRIPGAIERANEYLWTTQWIQTSKAFKYASVPCSPNPFGTNVGGPTPAGDLNGLFIASYGWLYNRTGDPKWKTRGDEIMAGLVLPVWAGSYGSSKQFTQAFAESYRYLGWR